MIRLCTCGVLALFVGAAFSPTNAGAADPKQPPAKDVAKAKPDKNTSLDDQLLEDLDNELLPADDNLPRIPSASSPDDPVSDDEAPEGKTDGEDVGQPGEQDPLTRIGNKMRTAGRLLERQKSAEKADPLQRQIVSDLSQLIEQLHKQCKAECSGGSEQKTAERGQPKQPKPGSKPGGKSGGPPRDSSERLGKNESRRPDMAEMQNLMKDVWGQLPQHEREQMLQYAPEEFLPKYELLIEKYYKRLAEQQKNRP